jgi:hypothetical protein
MRTVPAQHKWIRFEGGGRNIGQAKYADYKLYLTKQGWLSLRKGFYQAEQLKRFKSVVLYFDPSSRAFGMAFQTDTATRGALPIVTTGDNSGGYVDIRSFLRRYGLDPKLYAGRYEWKKEQAEGELYVIELRERAEPVVGPPARSGEAL